MDDNQKVKCKVCPFKCQLAEGQVGRCHARKNQGGTIVSMSYGKICAMTLDPVEDRQLAMWNQGKKLLSVGTFGCNMKCPFCQSSAISQASEDEVSFEEVTPEQLVQKAIDVKPEGCIGIAFTYNEPLVGYEFVRDTAKLAHESGLKVVVSTCGMIEEGAFNEVLPLVDAMNIDLKGFTPRFYQQCGYGDLEEVEMNIQRALDCPTCHVEISTLVVPTMTDPNELEAGTNWLAMLDPEIPYHVAQYTPAFEMKKTKPVSEGVVRDCASRAQKHLSNVFVDNL